MPGSRFQVDGSGERRNAGAMFFFELNELTDEALAAPPHGGPAAAGERSGVAAA